MMPIMKEPAISRCVRSFIFLMSGENECGISFLYIPLFFPLLLLRITVNGSNESIKRVMKKEHERGKNKCFKADINYSTNFDSVDL